jgi:hypothetical protein
VLIIECFQHLERFSFQGYFLFNPFGVIVAFDFTLTTGFTDGYSIFIRLWRMSTDPVISVSCGNA